MLLYNPIANWNLVDLSLACSFPFTTTSGAAVCCRIIFCRPALCKWDAEVVPSPSSRRVLPQRNRDGGGCQSGIGALS